MSTLCVRGETHRDSNGAFGRYRYRGWSAERWVRSDRPQIARNGARLLRRRKPSYAVDGRHRRGVKPPRKGWEELEVSMEASLVKGRWCVRSCNPC